ncbi:MAG TPA: matrixin family metalloprotease [Pyrinomonadaceae bacterium]
MIRKLPGLFVLAMALAAAILPGHGSSAASPEPTGFGEHRWLRNPIIVSLSSSMDAPPPNIKPGSDVKAAVQRALQSWSDAAGIQFLETTSSNETISPANEGDGVDLLTVSAANASEFAASDAPARTRVFYDSGGAIVEADIALNPTAQFSDDGTPGTYDLESTFTHEIGHLIGLEHSAVIGATMQPRQALNGVYGLPAFTQRSLSEDDIASARALYGRHAGWSSISGRLTTNVTGRARSIFGANIFAEDVASGNVVGSSISSSSGTYRVQGLRAGVYRVFAQPLDGPVSEQDIGANGSQAGLIETTPPFRSFVASSSSPSQSLNVGANSALRLSYFVFSRAPVLAPSLIGMNGELSTAPLPLRPGETLSIYVAGEGLDDITLDGISISSAFISIVPESLHQAKFDTPYPVISFDIAVSADIQPGDFTIRLQSSNGELAFLPGAITIER